MKTNTVGLYLQISSASASNTEVKTTELSDLPKIEMEGNYAGSGTPVFLSFFFFGV